MLIAMYGRYRAIFLANANRQRHDLSTSKTGAGGT
jgi:hypothetical protein